MVEKEKSEDHQSSHSCSRRKHERLYKISWKSIQYLWRYFGLNQSDGSSVNLIWSPVHHEGFYLKKSLRNRRTNTLFSNISMKSESCESDPDRFYSILYLPSHRWRSSEARGPVQVCPGASVASCQSSFTGWLCETSSVFTGWWITAVKLSFNIIHTSPNSLRAPANTHHVFI